MLVPETFIPKLSERLTISFGEALVVPPETKLKSFINNCIAGGVVLDVRILEPPMTNFSKLPVASVILSVA